MQDFTRKILLKVRAGQKSLRRDFWRSATYSRIFQICVSCVCIGDPAVAALSRLRERGTPQARGLLPCFASTKGYPGFPLPQAGEGGSYCEPGEGPNVPGPAHKKKRFNAHALSLWAAKKLGFNDYEFRNLLAHPVTATEPLVCCGAYPSRPGHHESSASRGRFGSVHDERWRWCRC